MNRHTHPSLWLTLEVHSSASRVVLYQERATQLAHLALEIKHGVPRGAPLSSVDEATVNNKVSS